MIHTIVLEIQFRSGLESELSGNKWTGFCGIMAKHMIKTNEDRGTRQYRYAFIWRSIGWIMLVGVLVLFLIPIPPSVETFSYEDKIYHALVFALLSLWYLQLYPKPGLIIVAFILFGLLVEWLQSFTPYRTADLGDFAADILGVFIGRMLYWTLLSTIVKRLDTELDRILNKLRND